MGDFDIMGSHMTCVQESPSVAEHLRDHWFWENARCLEELGWMVTYGRQMNIDGEVIMRAQHGKSPISL
jgi:hypothetical protein